MKTYLAEVDVNFDVYFTSLFSEVKRSFRELDSNRSIYQASYRRLVSFQAWRKDVLELCGLPDAAAFFTEAHNDMLMSHSLARQGAWRVALMSLRSAIENSIFCLYYLEHPVELLQWKEGRHKLGFSETSDYISRHPEFTAHKETDTGIAMLKKEYATLSRAVHGSSHNFRVTKHGEVQGLHVASSAELKKWAKREMEVVTSINLMLLVFFKQRLRGAGNQNLRKAISLAIPSSKHSAVKKRFRVVLRKVPT